MLYYKNKEEGDDSGVSSRHPSSVGRSSRHEADGGLTTELGACDVLLGRGTGPNEHIGNVRYRAFLVRKAMQDGGIMNYTSLSSTKKREVAKEVVASVKAMGGRFMKHAPHNKSGGGGDGGTTRKQYVEVPDNVAINKVKQGFRHQIKSNPRNRKDHNNSKTTSRETMIGKSIKPQSSQEHPPTARSSPLIVDTTKEKSLPNDQTRLLQVRGEKYDFLPSFSKADTAVGRPDFRVEGMVAPSMFDHARPITMNFPAGGVRVNTMRGQHLNRSYYCRPRSTMWVPHHRWPAPFSTMGTTSMPPRFLRMGPPILPHQPPFLLRRGPFTGGSTGNTAGLEGDPCVSGLLALRHERANNDMVKYRAPEIRQARSPSKTNVFPC